MNHLLRPRIWPSFPGVLGCWTLRRTFQVRLGTNTLWLPGGTAIFAVSR